jgi:molybdopterin molybdotransferase
MTALPDYPEALAVALSGVSALGRCEHTALDECAGRVLAVPITADRDLPPFNRAQMDGYALRGSEVGKLARWPLAGKIAAGDSPDVRVPPGRCVVIATGAALPDDVDTVIPHEWSDRGLSDRAAPGADSSVGFTVESIERGHAVHRRGADARAGDTLIAPGTMLAAQHLGIAAAVGQSSLSVRVRPRTAVLTSGDEVVPLDWTTASIAAHQIRNSNGPMLHELVRRFGGRPLDSRHLRDDRQQTIDAVRGAIDGCDLLITVGGVSVGERDHLPAAFGACGVKPSLCGASIQPGRPIFVGAAPNGCVVVGLPGNPVSVLACACLFVWPIVRAMLGVTSPLPWRTVELWEPVKPNPKRRAFRPAILRDDGGATVPSWAGSGDLAHTAPTHGLLELPVQSKAVAAGTRLRFLTWP